MKSRSVGLLPHPRSAAAFCAAVLFAVWGSACSAPDSPGQRDAAGADNSAADTSAAADSARALLDSLMAAESIPGLSAAVGAGTQVIWSEGFGYSDLTHQVKVTNLTKFRIGSVSKPLTAAAVALLAERGALDLDAPVRDYVPSFPAKRWTVTTRQLAGHIGGVRHYQGAEFLSSERYPTVLSGLAMFRDDPLVSEPGTEFLYSSHGWNLISAAVEGAAGGEAFLDFMDREVFGALGMDRTEADRNEPVIPHRTRFYHLNDDGEVANAPHVDNSYKWAGGGFLSTPEDLLVFAAAHQSPGFLRAETLEMLFTPQLLRDGGDTGYGVGWRSGVNGRGETVVSHGGGSVGGRTILTLNRDTGVIVAIAANLTTAPISAELAGRIEAIFRDGAGE